MDAFNVFKRREVAAARDTFCTDKPLLFFYGTQVPNICTVDVCLVFIVTFIHAIIKRKKLNSNLLFCFGCVFFVDIALISLPKGTMSKVDENVSAMDTNENSVCRERFK